MTVQQYSEKEMKAFAMYQDDCVLANQWLGHLLSVKDITVKPIDNYLSFTVNNAKYAYLTTGLECLKLENNTWVGIDRQKLLDTIVPQLENLSRKEGAEVDPAEKTAQAHIDAQRNKATAHSR